MKAAQLHSSAARWGDWLIAVCMAIVVCLSVPAMSSWLTSSRVGLSIYASENSPLEIAHSILAAVAGIIFFLSWWHGRGAVKVAGGAMGLLAAGAFLREFDFKHHAGGIEWLSTLGSWGLQDIFFVGALALIAVYLIGQRAYLASLVRLALRWQAWPFFAAGLLLGGAMVADDLVVTSHKGRVWEELSETYGYMFLLISAWRHYGLVGHPELDAVMPKP